MLPGNRLEVPKKHPVDIISITPGDCTHLTSQAKTNHSVCMEYIRERSDGIEIFIRVTPRASKTAVGSRWGDRIKIQLQAPPVDGKANACLVKFLASTLNIPRNCVTITHGLTSRDKTVHLAGLTCDEVATRLTPSS